MSNLNGNQFELSIPPRNTLRFVGHSHSAPPANPQEYPFAKVGPVVAKNQKVTHTFPGGGSWTQQMPEVRSVQPPLFVMPHEMVHHASLGDLGFDDSEVDSHGVPLEDRNPHDTNEDLMERKFYSPHPHSESVPGSVEKHGIKEPLSVTIQPTGALHLNDGHHRLAAAYHTRPNDILPIDWENAHGKTDNA